MARSTSLARESTIPQEFRLRCPSCSNSLVCKDNRAIGKLVRCPACGERFEARPAQAGRPAPTIAPADVPPETTLPEDLSIPGASPLLSAPRLYLGAAAVLAVGALGIALTCACLSGDGGQARRAAELQKREELARQADEKQKEEQLRLEQQKKDEQQKARIDSLLDQAREARVRKSFGEAESLYTVALELAPDNAVARVGLRDVHQLKAEKERLTKDVDDLVLRGRAAEERKDYAEAQVLYEEALAKLPGETRAASRLIVVKERLVVLRQSTEAERLYVICIATAVAFLEARQIEKALAEYQKALALKPGDRTALEGVKKVGVEQHNNKIWQKMKEKEAEEKKRVREAQEARARKEDEERQRSKERSERLLEATLENIGQSQQSQPPQMDFPTQAYNQPGNSGSWYYRPVIVPVPRPGGGQLGKGGGGQLGRSGGGQLGQGGGGYGGGFGGGRPRYPAR